MSNTLLKNSLLSYLVLALVLIPLLLPLTADATNRNQGRSSQDPAYEVNFRGQPGVWIKDKLSQGASWIGGKVGNLASAGINSIAGIFMAPGVFFASAWLYIAGLAFDWAAAISLSGESYNTSGDFPIYEGWTIIRDLANMLLIFIVVYIGITTIIGLSSGKTKSLLIRLVIFGLLINFSLMFAGLIIDASNIAAYSFYDAFPERTAVVSWLGLAPDDSRSLSWPFFRVLGITNAYLLRDTADALGVPGVGAPGAGDAPGWADTMLANGMGIILSFMAGLVLFIAATLFVVRTVVLWMLMMLAPIAFVGFILDGTKSIARKWWYALLKNAFWAPAFLLLYYLAAQFYTNSFYTDMYGGGGGAGAAPSTPTIIFGSLTAIIFLVAAKVIARMIGAYGAAYVIKTAEKYGKRTAGFAGRHTYGRAFSAVAESDAMKGFAARNPRVGGLAMRTFEAGGAASFGGKKGGYEAAKKRGVEQRVAAYKKIGKSKTGEDLTIERPAPGGTPQYVWRDSEGRRVLPHTPGASIKETIPEGGGTPIPETSKKQIVSAQQSYIEETGKVRSAKEPSLVGAVKTRKGARIGDRPGDTSGVTITGERWKKGELAKAKRDAQRSGNQARIDELKDVKTGDIIKGKEWKAETIGGRQTRADREFLLKIKKDEGKSTKEKLIDELDKDDDKPTAEPEPETPPAPTPEPGGGGTPA